MKIFLLIFLCTVSLFSQNNIYEDVRLEINLPFGISSPAYVDQIEGTQYINTHWTYTIMPSIYLNHTLFKSKWNLRWGIGLRHSTMCVDYKIPRGVFASNVDVNLLNLEDGVYDPPPYHFQRFTHAFNVNFELGVSRRFDLNNNWHFNPSISFCFHFFPFIIQNSEYYEEYVLDTNSNNINIIDGEIFRNTSSADLGTRVNLNFHKVVSSKTIFQLGISSYFNYTSTGARTFEFRNLTQTNYGIVNSFPVILELNLGLLFKL